MAPPEPFPPLPPLPPFPASSEPSPDRKSTRLNSSHGYISYAGICLKKNNGCIKDTYLVLTGQPLIGGKFDEKINLIYYFISFFFFNDTATTEIYSLSLHDALPI